MISSNNIGRIIRIEYDEDTGEMRLIMEITDSKFKSRILHSNTYDDVITISGKDVVVIPEED